MILIMDAEIPDENDFYSFFERVRAGLVRLDTVPTSGADTSPIEDDNKYLRGVLIDRRLQAYLTTLLHSALDNLGLVAEALNKIGPQHLYAEKSLIRTSLTAAAWALWMLGEDDSGKRLPRILRFVFKDFDGITSYLKSDTTPLSPSMSGTVSLLEGLLQSIVDHANNLESMTRTVKTYRHSRAQASDIAVVKYSAAFCSLPELTPTWVVMSGYAHSLPWAYLISAIETPAVIARYGMAIPIHTPNPRLLLMASDLALTVAEVAIGRFETLSNAPV